MSTDTNSAHSFKLREEDILKPGALIEVRVIDFDKEPRTKKLFE